jgi:CRISPR-associated protein Csm2
MKQGGKAEGTQGEQKPDEKIRKSIQSLNAMKDYQADNLVKDAEQLAGFLRTGLKTAQIRRIYGEVKRMQMDFKRTGFNRDRVVLLKPKMIYAANKKGEVRPLEKVLSACIDKVSDEGDFRRFVDFFEAILAYHKG